MPLPDVGELVEHVEIQNPLLSGLEVPEAGDDVPLVIIDVHVHVLGDDVDAAVAKDLLPQAVRENRAERRHRSRPGNTSRIPCFPAFTLRFTRTPGTFGSHPPRLTKTYSLDRAGVKSFGSRTSVRGLSRCSSTTRR